MTRRLLLLVTDLERGGTPTVVRELAVRLRAPNLHVEVACLAPPGPVAAEIAAARVEVVGFGASRSMHLPRTVARLVRLVRRHRIDTVFSFLVHANAVAALAKPFLPGVRLLQSIQTTQPSPRWHWRLQRLIAPAAERIVVPSPSVAAAGRERSGIAAGKFVVIPNAVDPDAFPRSPVPDADAASPVRPYPIGFLGRLDPVKRVPDLVLAIKFVETLKPGLVHLHVYGDGPDRPAVEAAINRNALRHAVTMHGSVADPSDALRSVGLLVLYSAAEGFGLVLIEAMAAGIPVVATRVPGIFDVVCDGETGLLVHANSPVELHFAVLNIVEEVELRRRLIAAGLRDVRDRFSWPAVLPAYRDLLDDGPVRGGRIDGASASP